MSTLTISSLYRTVKFLMMANLIIREKKLASHINGHSLKYAFFRLMEMMDKLYDDKPYVYVIFASVDFWMLLSI